MGCRFLLSGSRQVVRISIMAVPDLSSGSQSDFLSSVSVAAAPAAGLVSSLISDRLSHSVSPRFGSPVRLRSRRSKFAPVLSAVVPSVSRSRPSPARASRYRVRKVVYSLRSVQPGYKELSFPDGSAYLLSKSEVEQDEPSRHHTPSRPSVKLYADLLEVRSGKKRAMSGGGSRGVCAGFSRASRKRLIRSLAMVKTDGLIPYFVTLTYPAVWSDDWQVWKRDLATFRKRLLRVWSWAVSGGAWRVEFQKRGAPHYHLLIWCHSKVKLNVFRNWLSRAWADIVRDGFLGRKASRDKLSAYSVYHRRNVRAGAQFVKLDGRRAIRLYVSKYVAKVPEFDDDNDNKPKSWGRNWGFFGSVDMSPYVEIDIDDNEFNMLRRTVRKWLKSRNSHFYAKYLRFSEVLNVLALGAESVPDGSSDLTAIRMLQLVTGADYG